MNIRCLAATVEPFLRSPGASSRDSAPLAFLNQRKVQDREWTDPSSATMHLPCGNWIQHAARCGLLNSNRIFSHDYLVRRASPTTNSPQPRLPQTFSCTSPTAQEMLSEFNRSDLRSSLLLVASHHFMSRTSSMGYRCIVARTATALYNCQRSDLKKKLPSNLSMG